MKKLIILFIIINITACENKQNSVEKTKIINTGIISKKPIEKEAKKLTGNRKVESFDFSKPYYILDSSRIEDVGYLKKLCAEYFLHADYNIKNIKKLEKIWSGKLFSIGKCQVYKLDLINVCEAAGKNTLVVVSLDKKVMYQMNLQQFEPTLIQKNLPPVFSGRYYYRGGGAFYSYYVVNDTLTNFFESDLVTDLYSKYECRCFKNDKLTLKNIDLNNDGLIDLYFKGMKYNYCVGYASRTEKDTFVRDSVLIIHKYLLRKKGEKYYYEKE